MNPLVSISCITYNHAPYIRQCLDGFLMQECNFKYEILIHDDASTDDTQEIINEYAAKYPEIIKPYFQKENQYSKGVRGMNQKFNYPRAQGKYIALCEGDDYWIDPLKLQKQVDFLEENEDFVLTSHLRNLIDENNNLITNSNVSLNDFHTQCILFKNVLRKDFIDFDSSEITNGDTFLILYLENFGKSKILEFIGANYRISNQGVWSKKTFEERSRIISKSYASMKFFFKKYNYKKSSKKLEAYELDLLIKKYKITENKSISMYLKIFIKSLGLLDLNRIKSVIKLLC